MLPEVPAYEKYIWVCGLRCLQLLYDRIIEFDASEVNMTHLAESCSVPKAWEGTLTPRAAWSAPQAQNPSRKSSQGSAAPEKQVPPHA